jgi:hypothetical protein
VAYTPQYSFELDGINPHILRLSEHHQEVLIPIVIQADLFLFSFLTIFKGNLAAC